MIILLITRHVLLQIISWTSLPVTITRSWRNCRDLPSWTTWVRSYPGPATPLPSAPPTRPWPPHTGNWVSRASPGPAQAAPNTNTQVSVRHGGVWSLTLLIVRRILLGNLSVGEIRNEESIATNLVPDVTVRKIKIEKQNNKLKYQKNYQLFVTLTKLFGKILTLPCWPVCNAVMDPTVHCTLYHLHSCSWCSL